MIPLENGLRQADWKGSMPTQFDWQDHVIAVVQKSEWKNIVQDVQNFLERPADMDIFTKENILHMLAQSRESN